MRLAKPDKVSKAPNGMIWFGAPTSTRITDRQSDPVEKWGGWVYASDADTGEWKWRVRSNYPTISGILPTADGIAGGVISYRMQGKRQQCIALTAGMHHPQWPVKPSSARIVVIGLAN